MTEVDRDRSGEGERQEGASDDTDGSWLWLDHLPEGSDVVSAGIGAVASFVLNFVFLRVLRVGGSTGEAVDPPGIQLVLAGVMFFILIYIAIFVAVRNPEQSNVFAILATGLVVVLVTSWMYSSQEALSGTGSIVALLGFSLLLVGLTFYFAWQFKHPERSLITVSVTVERETSE